VRKVRLKPEEVETIVKAAREIFGDGVKVWLFGSRADLSKRGGDIDLFIETAEGYNAQKALEFLAKLYMRLGERRIDLIVEKENSHKEIAKEAKTTGVRLC